MTREEAIETIRRCCPKVGDSQCDFETAMRVLIPELAESEDERIRKWMIDEIKTIYDFESPNLNPMVEKSLAYLEKQKVFSNGEGLYYYRPDGDCTFIGTGELKPIEDIKINGKRPKTENKSVDLPGACPCEEKQKEQKPKNILTDDDSLQTAYLKGQTDVLEDPEAYGLQKEQKPAGWSEEDDEMVEEIKHIVFGAGSVRNGMREKIHDWLNNRLKYLRPQPKQEWSEEDEDKLYQIIETLLADKEVARRENPQHYDVLCKAYDELIAWLKSLRKKFKKED